MSAERFIEMTGETVEEAIQNGLMELGVGPNDVIVEVVEEPSRGVFGLGARPAKVRLQVMIRRPSTAPVYDEPEPPDEDDELSIDELGAAETTDEDAEVGKVVLQELLEKMSIRAKITVRRAEGNQGEVSPPWLLDVSASTDLSNLIGRRGETLAALQYITRLITSRELQRRANIIVDVDGYKSRRTSKLHELAMRMADQAVKQNRTVALEPMPPYERRIIHMALRSRSDVFTKSIGEGEARKVTIVPK
jgi:spoIIIJ-associated protein